MPLPRAIKRDLRFRAGISAARNWACRVQPRPCRRRGVHVDRRGLPSTSKGSALGSGLKGAAIQADMPGGGRCTGGVRPGVLMRSLPLTTRALIVLTVMAAALLSGYAALALPAHGNHLWWVVFLCAAMGGEALRVSSDGESGA